MTLLYRKLKIWKEFLITQLNLVCKKILMNVKFNNLDNNLLEENKKLKL
jgi:hypothetical protein